MKAIHDRLMLGCPELDEGAFQPRGRFAGMRFYGKGGGGSAPAPDPAIGQAAQANVALGKDWLNFAKEQFAEGNKRQEATDALTTKVANQQLQTQDEANAWAREDRNRTKTVFQPIEDKYIETVNNYATPAKQEEAAAAARADVQSADALQRQSSARQMAANGISPESGRFAGITRAQDLNTALASAGAANNARQVVRDKGLALTADTINMGKGLASSTAAAYGIGTNSGNSAVANNASANQNFYANQGVMGQGFQGAIGANNSAGSMLNNLYGNQLSAWQANQQASSSGWGGLGNLVGTLGGSLLTAGKGSVGASLMSMIPGFSDVRTKENVKPVGKLSSGVTVYEYEYKSEFKPVAGSGKFIGVMAQELEKVDPSAVFRHPSGFKMVDYSKVVNHGV